MGFSLARRKPNTSCCRLELALTWLLQCAGAGNVLGRTLLHGHVLCWMPGRAACMEALVFLETGY